MPTHLKEPSLIHGRLEPPPDAREWVLHRCYKCKNAIKRETGEMMLFFQSWIPLGRSRSEVGVRVYIFRSDSEWDLESPKIRRLRSPGGILWPELRWGSDKHPTSLVTLCAQFGRPQAPQRPVPVTNLIKPILKMFPKNLLKPFQTLALKWCCVT